MTLSLDDLPNVRCEKLTGHRLINTKFPPIHLFEDVAHSEDFEALYALQSLTNPRLQTEIGNLQLINIDDIPFGIQGCHYAAASFTHVNPDGSRFSDGQFGLMYIADALDTAIAEVKHHQQRYWQQVPDLAYDRFVFKQLLCTFAITQGLDGSALPASDPVYHPDDYSQARVLGRKIKEHAGYFALKYRSVRQRDRICYALFSPKEITEIIQAKHYEMIWDGHRISEINVISKQ
ncbi:MAG: RES family NAD+ phosphorylase [Cellvibrionaceae bacterium]|nr:RES family NAD+ phosphorylase [Cellvibrionaceae bacterium]